MLLLRSGRSQRAAACRHLGGAAARRRLSSSGDAAAAGAKVLLIGSGMVTPPVVDLLAGKSAAIGSLTVASFDLPAAEALAARHPAKTSALELDITDLAALSSAVADHDLVISLAPASFHTPIAEACIAHKKNMVTTSYVSDEMEALDGAAKAAGITILNEVGLDPGIDHLTAMRIIDDTKAAGGKVKSFVSFCGGLPAPEASFVPLQYKFSWSPLGVLVAGLNQAVYREGGEVLETAKGLLFYNDRNADGMFQALNLEGYANRDSTIYEGIYGIDGAETIIRGTLRYKGFCAVMRGLQELGLFDPTDIESLQPGAPALSWRALMAELVGNSDVEQGVAAKLAAAGGGKVVRSDGYTVTGFPPEVVDAVLADMARLGLLSDDVTAAQVGAPLRAVCAQLEGELQYGEGERDMVALSHQFVVENADGSESHITSKMMRMGEPSGYSAMAETVGTPCAFAVELVLSGALPARGVLRPVTPDVYLPLLEKLEGSGITFIEEERKIVR